MAFTEEQTKALSAKLRAQFVKKRSKNGVTLSYIEGWHAISEANRIFGFDGWDRETLESRCVVEDGSGNLGRCAYTSRIRITVRAEDSVIRREGTGFGSGTGKTLVEAHEFAIKEAETDATKRALATFGNSFGLALYDKSQKNVTGKANPEHEWEWEIVGPKCTETLKGRDASKFCSEMRKRLQGIKSKHQLTAFWENNQVAVTYLKNNFDKLLGPNGAHYGSVLEDLYLRRGEELRLKESANTDIEYSSSPYGSADLAKGNTEVANQSATSFNGSGRLRDKEHLKFVSGKACLVCGRSPSQAHHVRLAEPRALGRKVGDQWTVPLCSFHHRELHDAGNEERWWDVKGIDPLPQARNLWSEHQGEEATQRP